MSSTAAKILKLRGQNPKMLAVEISKQLGVSRERVRQILKANNLPTRVGHRPKVVFRAEYNCWVGMIRRCTNPRDTAFKRYGGRGIKVCNEWRDSFQQFLEDMGDRPSPKHSIDRINNDGNYEPGNCRWADWVQQANNTSANVFYTINQAREWRVRNGWSRAELAGLIGYAPETVYWMERGQTPPGRAGSKKAQPINPWVWLRYYRACQGLDAEIKGVPFKW